MRILISSHAFDPSVGGIETVARLLTGALTQGGHEVTLVTHTPGPTEGYACRVVRRPTIVELWRLAALHDVFLHNNISLRTAWPGLFARLPWVICHHTWTLPGGTFGAAKVWLKRRVASRARQLAVSNTLAERIGGGVTVVPNPYDCDLFRVLETGSRSGLIYVGRLVSDKGVSLLLRALADLHSAGCRESLTLVGDGPERLALQQQVRELGLESHVEFTGAKPPDEVAWHLNRHRVLVVPSRWEEPFGLVALEGIACGCLVVASDGGGLPEAVGPCGRLFSRGSQSALSAALLDVLDDTDLHEEARHAAPAHLAPYRPDQVARAYVRVFEDCIRADHP